MKVLWFTGVELPAVSGKKLTRAGWQEGLRHALHEYYPDIHLGIASFGSNEYQPFRKENATYYNVYREPEPGTRWERLFYNWRHFVVDEGELERCLKIVGEFKPDLIYIFGSENPFGLLINQFSVPSIISIQAIINACKKRVFTGLPTRDVISEVLSIKFIMGVGVFHKWWRMCQQAKVEREIFRRCLYYDGRTTWDKQWLKVLNPHAKYFHVDRILGEVYYRAEWNSEEADQYLVYTTSSNAAFKGGVSLVRAFVELKKRGRSEIKLHMAGVHPKSRVGKTIRRLIERYQLQNQITMLGRILPSQIITEMKRGALFVLPSHIDNSPNSLAEAMLLGMPCIASNAGGVPSMLEDGVEGLIYPHKAISSLADKIEVLVGDPKLAREYGMNAREKALRRHDPERIADMAVSMYKEVLRSNNLS